MPASTRLWLASAESFWMWTCSIDKSSRSELVASCTKSTTAGRSAVCTMCGAPQLVLRVIRFDARDDEKVRPHDTRGEHGKHVLRVGADGGDEPARAVNAGLGE